MTARGQQPKCVACSHPASFHGGGETRCRALGCHCADWEGPLEVTVTVQELAQALGRGQTFVKDHAVALGGEKVKGRWRFPLERATAAATEIDTRLAKEPV